MLCSFSSELFHFITEMSIIYVATPCLTRPDNHALHVQHPTLWPTIQQQCVPFWAKPMRLTIASFLPATPKAEAVYNELSRENRGSEKNACHASVTEPADVILLPANNSIKSGTLWIARTLTKIVIQFVIILGRKAYPLSPMSASWKNCEFLFFKRPHPSSKYDAAAAIWQFSFSMRLRRLLPSLKISTFFLTFIYS